MRDGRHRGVVLGGGHAHGGGADVDSEIANHQLGGRVGSLPHDHPGAPGEQIGIRCRGTGALAPGHRVRADVTADVSPASPDLGGDAVLDGRDIGDHGTRMAVQLAQDDARGDIGRRGDHDDARFGIITGPHAPGPHVAGQGQRCGRGVGQVHLDAGGGQGQGQGGAQQAGAHDEDRSSGRERGRAGGGTAGAAHSPTSLCRAVISSPVSRRVRPGRREPSVNGPSRVRARRTTG